MKTLMNQMKLRKGLLLGGIAILGGLMIFGMILHDVIQSSTNAEDVFPMGGFMGLMGFFLVALLIVGQDFWQSFNHAVSMSQARKRFVPAYIASVAVCQIIFVIVLKVFISIERLKLAVMYPTLPYDGDFSLIFSWKVLFCLAIGSLGIGIFLGAMLLKFGKAAYVVVWVLWMLVCIGVPKLMEYSRHHKNTVVGRILRSIGAAFENAVPSALPISIIVISAALVVIAYLMLRKQPVST
ncbi:MAG: hypothetical protein PUD20_07445 [bacterium]|nr:hypothetical protein [bacterium]